MYESNENRSKRSPNSVLDSKIKNSEETNQVCTEGEGLDGLRDKISRVALAHLLAWGEIRSGSNYKDFGKIQNFYDEINSNAGELDPVAGILSRHLSLGAELYYK